MQELGSTVAGASALWIVEGLAGHRMTDGYENGEKACIVLETNDGWKSSYQITVQMLEDADTESEPIGQENPNNCTAGDKALELVASLGKEISDSHNNLVEVGAVTATAEIGAFDAVFEDTGARERCRVTVADVTRAF